MIRLTAIVILIALVLPQQVLPGGEPAGGDEVHRLEVPARAGKGAGPLDWVYEKVDSARDDWSVERLSDRLKAPLDDLAASTLVHPGGQSGQPGHPDYSSHFEAFATGQRLPLWFDDDDLAPEIRHRLSLTPQPTD